MAYYLLHSMDGQGDFVERDRTMAAGFRGRGRRRGHAPDRLPQRPAPRRASCREHLASRVEVGEIFLDAPVPAAVLQAGVVLGDGSASFDMLRHLTERLPAMVAPKWVDNRIQPIAVDDVVHYLVGAADLPADSNRTFDIGGPEVLTYAEMMQRYAAGRRHRAGASSSPSRCSRPGLAGLWVGLVTPDLGRHRPPARRQPRPRGDLPRGRRCATVIGPPPGGLTGFDEAVRAALRTVDPLLWRRTVQRTAATVGGRRRRRLAPHRPEVPLVPRPSTSRRWQPPTGRLPRRLDRPLRARSPSSTAAPRPCSPSATTPRTPSDLERALAVNMVLNAGWSGLFFRGAPAVAGRRRVRGAHREQRRPRPTCGPAGRGKATGLLAYAGWCAFATALTTAIARRNR